MSRSTTLLEFLENTGAQVKVYDIGRRVGEIERNTFLAFERTDSPYPLPMQRKAWFAVIQLRTAEVNEPIIWFLRLNLDEQGKLVQTTRDYLIQRFAEIAQNSGDQADLGQALQDNPYAFKPRDDRMAVFHAKFAYDSKQPASRFYDHAKTYFTGEPGWEQWNFVGYQGIADVAARAGESDIAKLLTTAIPSLPDEPLKVLCHCLENEKIDSSLSQAIAQRLDLALQMDKPDIDLVSALIRGLSLSQDTNLQSNSYTQALTSKVGTQIEVLAAVSGRAWQCLAQPDLATLYLETLAKNDAGQDAFNHCLGDLLSLPELQKPLLDVLRRNDRSGQLANCFQEMTNSSRQ